MKILYDEERDILYIDLAPGKKARETKPLNDDVFVDVGEDGGIVGIEIWRASVTVIEPLAKHIAEKARKALELVK